MSTKARRADREKSFSMLGWSGKSDLDDSTYSALVSKGGGVHDGSLAEAGEARDKYLASLSAEDRMKMIHRDRIKRFMVSDESRDRDGERVMLDGWDLKEYEENPVVLMMHDRSSVPVAKALDVGVYTVDGKAGLYAWAHFPAADVSAKADEAFRAVQGRLITAVSAGFSAKSATFPVSEEHAKELDVSWPWGCLITKAVLREFSLVSIPSNRNSGLVGKSDEEGSDDLGKEAAKAMDALESRLSAVEARLKALADGDQAAKEAEAAKAKADEEAAAAAEKAKADAREASAKAAKALEEWAKR